MILMDVLSWAETQSARARVSSVDDAARELGHSPAEIDRAFCSLLASGAITCRSVTRDRRFGPEAPEGNIYLGVRVRRH